MATDGTLRVFLCDDTEQFRALMRSVLPDDRGLVVVGEAADGRSCAEGVLRTEADAVLLDLAMPHRDGLTAIEELRRRAPACAIVVFSGFEAAAMADRCLELGAHAYVEKGARLAEVRATLRRAVAVQRAPGASRRAG